MRTTAKVIVLGGGLIGTLAKFLIPDALVLDWRKVPPRRAAHKPQFGAFYLWKALDGIPCHEWKILTTIDGDVATYGSASKYKTKIGKPRDMDSPTWGDQFWPEKRGYTIKYLPGMDQQYIRYDVRIKSVDILTHTMESYKGEIFVYDTLISAIPLPSLLKMCGIWGGFLGPDDSHFPSAAVCVKATLRTPDMPPLPDNTIRVNYISDSKIPAYRSTDREDQRHYEWLESRVGRRYYGVPTHIFEPGKIWPSNNEMVGDALHLLAINNVHPFGRFPRWRPDELTHESYADLQRFAANL